MDVNAAAARDHSDGMSRTTASRREQLGFPLTHGAGALAAALVLVVTGTAGCESLAAVDREVVASQVAPALQQDVDAITAAGAVGAVAELVDHDAAVAVRSGTAALGSSEPVPLNGHFRLGSATKPFIAVVVLQLVDEGLLSLDDPVSDWVPDLVQGNGNDGQRITIRHLLQHTSGLFDYLRDWRFISTVFSPEVFDEHRYRDWTPEELVALAVSHPPSFAPGTGWQYSNTGYVLAGMVIEAVTGETWEQQVQERIIEPLGLTRTYAPGSEAEIASPFARGYELFGVEGGYFDVTVKNMTMAGASGALISSTGDLNRFFLALMRGELLSPAQLAEMMTTVPIGNGQSYGLGLFYNQLPCTGGYWSHDGTTLGYETRTGVLDDGSRSVVVSVTTTDALYGSTRFDESSEKALSRLIHHALCPAPGGF